MGCAVVEGFSGVNIEKIPSSFHGFIPITGRKRCSEKKSAHDIINGANSTLGLAVLRRCVWTG